MSKPQPIRNRKNEMISCWVCASFVALVYIVKGMLLGFGAGSIDIALFVLFGAWVAISVVYTVIYLKNRDMEM